MALDKSLGGMLSIEPVRLTLLQGSNRMGGHPSDRATAFAMMGGFHQDCSQLAPYAAAAAEILATRISTTDAKARHQGSEGMQKHPKHPSCAQRRRSTRTIADDLRLSYIHVEFALYEDSSHDTGTTAATRQGSEPCGVA